MSSLPAPLAAASVAHPAIVLGLVGTLESAFAATSLHRCNLAREPEGRVNRFRFNVGRLYRRRPVVGSDDFTSNGAILSGEPKLSNIMDSMNLTVFAWADLMVR